MAIKRVNADMLDKIANSDKVSESNESVDNSSISQDKLEELYEAGIEEINEILLTVGLVAAKIRSSSFAPVLMNSDVVQEFLAYMMFFGEDILPKLLKGDIDGIMENTVEGSSITSERLQEMRKDVYELLKERY